MALVVNDRVQQTGTANTTVSFTLTGSVTGYQSFAVIGNGNTTFYAATDVSGSWEVGIGTYSTTGPTLTRTTILSSSNSGSAVTFSGTVNVFVTYPSERSVNLDASGNVTALGTITSGVWNGSTIPVAYGGTGVTTSSGANSVVLRDASQNISFNNYVAGYAVTTAAAGTTVLTVASARNQILIGSTTQTFQLPNATTLQLGQSFLFLNNSSGVLTVKDNASTTIDTIPSGAIVQIGVTSIATSAGSWSAYSFLPGSYDFNNTTATFNNAAISNAVWNGTTIASGYGGTGLTTFGAANYALYSTSASALTAGTLPVAAGGTGIISLTAGYIPYGNGTSALSSSSTLNYDGTTLSSTRYTSTATVTASSNVGAYAYGTLNYSDTNIMASYSSSVNGYNQVVLQNLNAGASASTSYIVSNNNGTSTTGYGDFGINSSGFSGTGSLNGPGNVFLASASTDLAIGTYGSNNIRLVTNSQATDALTIGTANQVAFNGSYGTTGQVLTSAGSGAAPSWTTLSTGGGTVTTTDFTATSGQTVFTVNYTVGSTEVYQNGAKLGIADFTATNGTSITLATGATTGDLIEVVTFSNLNLYSTITSETFNGTGSQTVFTMSAVPANAASLLVAISGVVQEPTTYSVSSNTLTFSTAPPSASGNISVRYLGIATTGSSFSAGTTGFTPSSATTGAVVLGGTLNVANGGTGLTTAGSAGQVLTTNGSTLSYGSAIVSGTAVASTSGTSIDFTSIPSWVKRITVMFYGTSTSGTSTIWLQIGSSGTPQTTGYVGKSTSAFVMFVNPLAAGTLGGNIILTNPTGNNWCCSGNLVQSDGNSANGTSGGYVSLSGILNIVRITTANGTDTFDAGTLNILYE